MTAIKLKTGEVDILRAIAHNPRTLRSLTHSAERNVADVQLAPITITLYIQRLKAVGFISEPRRDYFVATDAGQEYLEAVPVLTPSVLICPASTKDPYIPPAWPVRSGADDHRRHASRGMG